MDTLNQTIRIKEILLITSNNEITIIGTINRDFLHYETEINISSTQLNLIINQLQKSNPDCDISEMFHSRVAENGQLIFFFDSSFLKNSSVELNTNMQNNLFRQIRA